MIKQVLLPNDIDKGCLKMKKVFLFLLVFVLMLCLAACKTETVTLHCDGENCENSVEVEVKKGSTPDESWVVFCQDCADNVLDD